MGPVLYAVDQRGFLIFNTVIVVLTVPYEMFGNHPDTHHVAAPYRPYILETLFWKHYCITLIQILNGSMQALMY